MSNYNQNNPLLALSDGMAEAVAIASTTTIMVNARRRLPASGIAYQADLVLTADHVVERDEDIIIGLPDGSEQAARIAGRDPDNDLVLLRIDKPLLKPASPAPEDVTVGQLVLAVGRPSMEGIQASLGIISATGGPVRTGRGGLLERYLRTDATPYPGFSGGPLIDISGQVLGVNTSGLARGVSLAIPVSLAWQVAESLNKHGSVRRGYLGIRSQPVTIPAAQQKALGRSQETGLLLVNIENNSPAELGRLLVGDILVGLASKPITDPDELLANLTSKLVGQDTVVEILRGGQPMQLSVKVGER